MRSFRSMDSGRSLRRVAFALRRIALEMLEEEKDAKRKDAASNFTQMTLGGVREAAKEAVEAKYQRAADAQGRDIGEFERSVRKDQSAIERLLDGVAKEIYDAVWEHPEDLKELRGKLKDVMYEVWGLVGNGPHLEGLKKKVDAMWDKAGREIFL